MANYKPGFKKILEKINDFERNWTNPYFSPPPVIKEIKAICEGILGYKKEGVDND